MRLQRWPARSGHASLQNRSTISRGCGTAGRQLHRERYWFFSMRSEENTSELQSLTHHDALLVEVTPSLGARVVAESERNIARVRNCWAATAQGKVLVFLD